VAAPLHYVEILRDDGSPAAVGEQGEVVVTSLVNYAMPHIRYRIGDVACWSDRNCECGRHWPLLSEVG
jgi:phenylacetate-CoA ligase